MIPRDEAPHVIGALTVTVDTTVAMRRFAVVKWCFTHVPFLLAIVSRRQLKAVLDWCARGARVVSKRCQSGEWT